MLNISKKVKVLKNTLMQFEEEHKEVVKEIEDTVNRLRVTDKRIKLSRARHARLNIELGELKILLHRITREASGVGTGLGLPICARIIAAHGGHLAIERSESLGGARFVVWLPEEGQKAA